MEARRRWIQYDTFKLIVALALLLLLIVLVIALPGITPPGRATQEAAAGAVLPTRQPATATDTISPPTSTPAAQPSPTAVQPTPTLPPPPTATAEPPTPTPTVEPPTPTPAAAVPEPPTPTPTAPPALVECTLALPSRLSVGSQAVVVTDRGLNLRQEAGMDKAVIRVGLPNEKVEVTGGPVCIPYQDGAYLWWQIKYRDGKEGWSAEAALTDKSYYLQPAP